MFSIRTDLAEELRAHAVKENSEALLGVRYREKTVQDVRISTVEILDENGEKLLGKPIGRYVTLTHGGLEALFPHRFLSLCDLVAKEIRLLCKGACHILFVGLGNEALAADAVGVIAASHVLSTHGMRKEGETWFSESGLCDVSVLTPSVLMKTGIDSSALVRFAVEHLHPDAVIAVDSLVAHDPLRLARTVQLSDAGIVPGAGVDAKKSALNEKTLGVPVIAIGVPTAIDAATLAAHEREKAGLSSAVPSHLSRFFVTPSEIDAIVSSVGKLIGVAFNRAFQVSLSWEELLLL